MTLPLLAIYVTVYLDHAGLGESTFGQPTVHDLLELFSLSFYHKLHLYHAQLDNISCRVKNLPLCWAPAVMLETGAKRLTQSVPPGICCWGHGSTR